MKSSDYKYCLAFNKIKSKLLQTSVRGYSTAHIRLGFSKFARFVDLCGRGYMFGRRRYFCAGILAITACSLRAQVSSGPYAIVSRTANSRVWQNVTCITNSFSGGIRYLTNSYTELCTGICYQTNQTNGQWLDSTEVIEPIAGGAQAVHGPHRVKWATTAVTPDGTVDVKAPDGKEFTSSIVGIAYCDLTTGSNTTIATVKDCNGSIVGANRILYADAFSNLTADISYQYNKAGLSQNVVLRQSPPAPDQYGMSDKTTVLQVYTEFFNAPSPTIYSGTNQFGIDNRILDFGEMRMGVGKALFVNSTNDLQSLGVVSKRWLTIDNRTFLVESIPYQAISNQLQQLPQANNLPAGNDLIRRTAFLNHRSRRSRGFSHEATPMHLANIRNVSPSVMVDYELLNSSGAVTLQGDTTYLVTGTVNVTSTLTVEGGAVIKYTNSADATISSTSYNSSSRGPRAFYPAVFTSMNDNSVGQIISGSTGAPTVTSCVYLSLQLYSTQTLVLNNLRFSYAATGVSTTFVYGGDGADGAFAEFSDCQFYDCEGGLNFDIENETATLKLYNDLFAQCTSGVGSTLPYGDTLYISAINVTGDHLEVFASGTACAATNCMFTGIYTLDGAVCDHCCISSSTGVYQTVGAGGYYLAVDSTNRNAGNTNIDPSVLTDLQTKTTYPPVVTAPGWFTNDYTFCPQVERDPCNPPDLGYHYPPIDYAIDLCVSNATLNVLPGTVLATIDESGYGIWLYANAAFNCIGTATAPISLVCYNTVQEQSNTNWENPTLSELLAPSPMLGSVSCYFSFTDFSVLGDSAYCVNAESYGGTSSSVFQNCQFYNSMLWNAASSMSFTNCLMQRPSITLLGGASNSFYNNLFWQGELTITGTPTSGAATFENNLFDSTVNSLTRGAISIGTSSNNAYVTTNSGVLPPENNDVILSESPNYQSGALGDYYYPTNQTNLIYAGSESAASADLYYYTVTTNNVIDGTNMVSIGFHYVAVGADGDPLDLNDDGIPDYLEYPTLPNDGYNTPGAWYVANGLNPDAPGIGLFDADQDGLPNYQEYLYGTRPNVSEGFAIWVSDPAGTSSIP